MSYYTKITKAGLAAITAAMNNNSKVPITYMAFGDGNGYIPEPDENATSLVNEVYRVGVNKVEVHNKNPNWLVCEAIIPSAVGGFNIREVALYDSTGATMLAIASYPPTYKPTVEEGAAKIQTIRIVIQVDNSGNFELIVDPDVVLATVELVEQKINKNNYRRVSFAEYGISSEKSPEENYQNLFKLINAFPEENALDIFVNPGEYKFSKGVFITRPHYIHGIGVGELSTSILDFEHAIPVGTKNYKSGIFIIHPDVINDNSGNGANLPIGQIGLSGTGATIENVKVLKSREHGIIKNAPSYLKGVGSMNNQKHGILTVANTKLEYFGIIRGIANQGSNTECAALYNGWSGIIEIGDDANVVKNDTCLAAYNNHFGFYDASLLGGVNINGQAHINTKGDYVMQGSLYDDSGLAETPARTVFVGCYSEGQRPEGFSVNDRSLVLGATGCRPESHNINTLLPSIVGLYTHKRLSIAGEAQVVYDRKGGDFVSIGLNEVLLGSSSAPNSNFSIKSAWNGRVSMQVGDNKDAIVFFLEDFNTTLKVGRPWFNNGLTMGTYHYQGVSTTKPTNGIWDIGNILWNESSVIGAPIGWACSESSGSGTWQEIGQCGIQKLQSSDILDKSHNINLQNKFFGKEIFNTTTNKFMRSLGDQDISDWLATDNTILTPQ